MGAWSRADQSSLPDDSDSWLCRLQRLLLTGVFAPCPHHRGADAITCGPGRRPHATSTSRALPGKTRSARTPLQPPIPPALGRARARPSWRRHSGRFDPMPWSPGVLLGAEKVPGNTTASPTTARIRKVLPRHIANPRGRNNVQQHRIRFKGTFGTSFHLRTAIRWRRGPDHGQEQRKSAPQPSIRDEPTTAQLAAIAVLAAGGTVTNAGTRTPSSSPP